jgi:TRAP-type mannitol/chloroaromatic compound transport system permease small subunit
VGSRIGRAFDRLLIGMNAAGSVWILLLILLVAADALGRSFFLYPIVGTTEMVTLSIVGIVFLQLADTVRGRRLTRSDSFLGLLQLVRPRAAAALEALFCLLGAIFMALGLWGSVPLLREAVERNHWIGNEGVFTAPVWPVKTIIVAGLAVCLIQFLRLAAEALARMKRL